jgi:hypothetical protein
MRVRRKISPHRVTRRRNIRQKNVATMAMACIVLALAVDALMPGDAAVSPAAAVERSAAPSPQPRVETVFAAVRAAPPVDVPAAPQHHAQLRCGDFDFSFLNASCSTAWRRHSARLHRPATFVAGAPSATPTGPQVAIKQAPPKPVSAQAGPAKPPAVAAATSLDRAPPPTKKLKPAVTAGLAAAIQ